MTESNYELRTIRDTNAYIRSLIEKPAIVNDYFWIGGVVTYAYKSHLNHTYFTITDEQHSISCMLSNRYVDKSVYIKKGTMIDVYGVIQVYQKEAKVQMMVSDVRLAELDESSLDVSVLEQLEEKGLFPRTKRDLPVNPKQISLITSKSSEALNDFQYIYKQQEGKAQIRVLDTLVQGKQAPKLIAQRIEETNHNRQADIIVLTRGGGRHEDLSTFNDILIAEAICQSKIPIVTGIGHERNETIADRVADQATISPTDAAYKLATLSTSTEHKNAKSKITSNGNNLLVYIFAIVIALLSIIIIIFLMLQT